MRTLVFLLLATLSLTTPVARYTAPPPDLSTPKSAVRSFIEAARQGDIPALKACVVNPSDSLVVEKFLKTMLAEASAIEFKDCVAEVENEGARVSVQFLYQETKKQERTLRTEILSLSKQGESWKITPFVLNVTDIKARPLLGIAALLSTHGKTMESLILAREKARKTVCVSNVKQLAIGTMMYVQDYDEVFPSKSAPYKELLWIYVKDNDAFRCPGDAEGALSYTINPNVLGASMERIKRPAETVLFYEGKSGKLDFRHDGYAAVAFADGHVKMIDAEGAKALIWKVSPPPTTKKPINKKQSKARKRG
jgi:prepilin-type processing-associated H-X9-DG protein